VILKVLPPFLRAGIASLSGRLAYRLTPRRVKIALENLHAAFPQLADREARDIVRGVYGNLAANAVDEVHLDHAVRSVVIDPETSAKLHQLDELSQQGRPLIFVSGHFGNWEVMGQFLATRFPGLNFLAKEQSNPYADRLVNRIRRSFGAGIVLSHEAPRSVPKILKAGGKLAMIVDQDAGREGVMINFLGRPASYFRGWALFSYHYNAPVTIVFLRRRGSGYCVKLSEIIQPNLSVDKDTEINRLLTLFSDRLAEEIIASPDQWLWTHRRWKSGALPPLNGADGIAAG
jgi:Kdo2-lipid IVA lauroyltransferase/acyltransferase